MVFFICNGCGGSLKKNQVEKHQFQCRKSHHLSCMDCNKDFLGEDYKAHVKCISEEEKYSAKGFVAKPGQNKNERKQTEWVALVQNLVNTVGNTDSALTQALQKISQHENIPRKKPKFMNFLKNILGQRVNPSLCEQAWGLISKALEEQRASKETNGNSNKTDKEPKDEMIKEGTSNSNKKRKNGVENDAPVSKREKKDVKDDNGHTSNDEETGEPAGEDSSDAQASGKVKWNTIAKTILRGQDDKEMQLKKFQKKIIGEYLSRAGNAITDASVEVLWAKCLKKLSKNPKFKIHKERIKLVS